MPHFITVGSGAALGTGSRYLLTVAFGGGLIPLLILNIIGSALMGYARPGPFWGTGFLGGFTSFASFAFYTANTHWSIALAYVTATLVGCTAAYLAGDKLR